MQTTPQSLASKLNTTARSAHFLLLLLRDRGLAERVGSEPTGGRPRIVWALNPEAETLMEILNGEHKN